MQKLTQAQQKILDEMKRTGAAIESTRTIKKDWVYRLNGNRVSASVVMGLLRSGAISENRKAFALDRSYTVNS